MAKSNLWDWGDSGNWDWSFSNDEPFYYDDWGMGSDGTGDMSGDGFFPAGSDTSSITSWINGILGTEFTGAELGLGALGLGGLASSLTQGPQTSTSTATRTYPDWYTAAQQAALTDASNLPSTYAPFFDETGMSAYDKDIAELMGQGATPYGGQLSAGADVNQVAGADLAVTGAGSWVPGLLDAQGLAGAGSRSILDRDLARYMNPYIDSVLDPQLRRQFEDQSRELNEFDAARVSRGAFGTGRSDLMKNQMQERQGLARQELENNAYKAAYDNAMGLMQGDRSAQQWGSGAMGNLAGQGQNLRMSDINVLMSTGGALQGIDQGAADRYYQDFLRGDQWRAGMVPRMLDQSGAADARALGEYQMGYQMPYNQNAAFTGALRGMSPNTTATETTQGADPNLLGQLTGAGSTLWGIMNPNGLA